MTRSMYGHGLGSLLICQWFVIELRHQPTDVNSLRYESDCPVEFCRHGHCVMAGGQPYCLCSEGFQGTACDEDVDDCQWNPCHFESACIDLVGGYRCECTSGFTGASCETDIDECLDAQCDEGSVCVDYQAGYHCVDAAKISHAMLLLEAGNSYSASSSDLPTGNEMSLETLMQETVMFLASQSDPKILEELGYPMDSFLIKCSQGIDSFCYDLYDSYFLDAKYGNCYTFNNHAANTTTIQRAGRSTGLRTFMKTNSGSTMDHVAATGVRMVIHNSGKPVFPDMEGFLIAPGSNVEFALVSRMVSRLGKPYGDCVDEQNMGSIQPYYYNTTEYDSSACERSIEQDKYLRKCGCGHPRLALPSSHRMCNSSGEFACLQSSAMFSHTNENDGTTDQNCPYSCREESYAITQTYLEFPANQYSAPNCKPSDHLCINQFRSDHSIVKVFYKKLGYILHEESPKETIPTLLAAIGSDLGLTLGCSVISIIEIFQLIPLLITKLKTQLLFKDIQA